VWGRMVGSTVGTFDRRPSWDTVQDRAVAEQWIFSADTCR